MYAFRLCALMLAMTLTVSGCGEGYASSHAVAEEALSEDEALLTDGPGDQTGTEVEPEPEKEEEPETPVTEVPKTQEELVLAKYEHLDPKREVPTDLLKKAVLYFDANLSKFPNKNYLSVIDFAKKSSLKRFFVIDLKTGVVWALRTSHGKGSDANHDGFAEKFSNVSGSNASSLGVYKTAETYSGSHGYSLRLDGLSSTNSKARSRAIVIHGASYVTEANVIQGRSWGCPAIAMAHKDKLIDTVKGGSMIYAGLSGAN